MNGKGTSTSNLSLEIAKGWKPNNYLTNMSMAYFQEDGDFVAPSIFPICPVQLSSSYYYIFSKADLARDNVARKPAFGKVTPAVMGQTDATYKCEVDQIIVGVDQIDALNYGRSRAPGVADPRRAKVRFATEQLRLHLDIVFASKFFKTGVWTNEKTGKASNPGTNEFLKFSASGSDPIGIFDDYITAIKKNGRRKPNRLALGIEAFNALKNHPDIVDRVKYTGTTANPARVTPQVLAQLLGIEQVKVMESTYNSAALGATESMNFVCSPKDALLCYAPSSAAIDEPSAGYIFTWDMLGNGQNMAMDQFEGEKGTHSEFIEGIMSTDMKKTSDDLAVYLKDCV